MIRQMSAISRGGTGLGSHTVAIQPRSVHVSRVRPKPLCVLPTVKTKTHRNEVSLPGSDVMSTNCTLGLRGKDATRRFLLFEVDSCSTFQLRNGHPHPPDIISVRFLCIVLFSTAKLNSVKIMKP